MTCIERHCDQLSDPCAMVRVYAALRLGCTNSQFAVPALTRALKDSDSEVRTSAAIALGVLGPKAASAVPALTTLVNDPDGNRLVRISAARAITAIKCAGVKPAKRKKERRAPRPRRGRQHEARR